MRILISNADGYLSPGLYLLADVAEEFGDVLITSTEYPRSASGREITFSRPLRYVSKVYGSRLIHVTDGTPIDALHLAVDVTGFKPDLVLSGVNVGDNLSLQHVFYSGTLAVAIESALMGITSIAFSSNVKGFKEFEHNDLRNLIKSAARGVISYVVSKGLPKGVDLLSINIPLQFNSCVKLAKAARIRWSARYEEGLDPRGRKYYWLYGVRGKYEENTDVEAFDKGCLTITPLNINLNVGKEDVGELRGIEEWMQPYIPRTYFPPTSMGCRFH